MEFENIKELEAERKLYQRGYNSCKRDIVELIDEWIKDYPELEKALKVLKSRIGGKCNQINKIFLKKFGDVSMKTNHSQQKQVKQVP